MSFFKTLSKQQQQNAAILDNALKKHFKNKHIRAGILAVVSKESAYQRFKETSYSGTSNARIRQIFGSRVSGMSDAELTALKSNYNRFFDVIYGGDFGRRNLGNTQPGDGSRYVGRGYNGVTGRANYKEIGEKIGVDLISNPELLENPKIAALACAEYFRQNFAKGSAVIQRRYSTTVDKVDDTLTAARIAHNANMGWGNTPENDPTGGWQSTRSRIDSFYENLSNLSKIVKDSPGIFGVVALGAIGLWLADKYDLFSKVVKQ
jgi:predicted chitinase